MIEGRKEPVTFGSLFAGIGGFDLGFERAGMVCRWQVENDPYCLRVLNRHWRSVARWNDVATFPPPAWISCDCCENFICTWHRQHAHDCDDAECPELEAWDYEWGLNPYKQPHPNWNVDVICGGFPCQDLSIANPSGVGLTGERSGLWNEFARIICELRPRIVVVENVPTLVNGWLGRILGDLAESGYDAEWDVLPAAAFGYDHLRERLFIVAYAINTRPQGHECRFLAAAEPLTRYVSRRDCGRSRYPTRTVDRCVARCGRKRDGISGWVDRLRGLGNAVVPDVAEWIGRRLIESA